MMASYAFPISFGVNIILSMIADFNVCGLLDFCEGSFSADCNDRMLTLFSFCVIPVIAWKHTNRLTAVSACAVRKHHC